MLLAKSVREFSAEPDAYVSSEASVCNAET
jgi:hypothetical protein